MSIVAAFYKAHLSPVLNGCLEILHFERSDAIEIRDRVMFVFYSGLPHYGIMVVKWIVDCFIHRIYSQSCFCLPSLCSVCLYWALLTSTFS